MEILISNTSEKPIYEQIVVAVKNAIAKGELPVGAALPSIRALANDLRISVITTKRAYEELEKEGCIVTVPQKGSFVAAINPEYYREEQLRKVEDLLSKALQEAKHAQLSTSQLCELLLDLDKEDLL